MPIQGHLVRMAVQGRLDDLLKDPVAGSKKVEKILDDYIRKIAALEKEWESQKVKIDQAEQILSEMNKTQGVEAGNRYYNEVVIPLRTQTGYTILNIRHYSLSALSLKQYIEGRLFIRLKAMALSGNSNKDFFDNWRVVQSKFTASIAKYIELRDI